MESNLILINQSISLTGVFLCILGIFQVKMMQPTESRINRYFYYFYSVLFFFALSNLIGLLLRGVPGSFVHAVLTVTNFLELSLPCMLAYTAPRYYLTILDPEKKRKGLRYTFAAFLFIHLALVLISQFTGLLYIIDKNNFYRRTAGYPLSLIMPAAILLLNTVLLIGNRENVSRKEQIAFWLYLFVPGSAMILQLIFYGLNLVVLSSILIAVVIYLVIISDQSEKLEAQTKELTELKVSILTQQIQPHFIYNTMNTAYLLSENQPEQARSLISDFITYLKSNINALSSRLPLPFAEELKTTRAYADILLKRYRGRFSVEYELNSTDFTLPALTLQPIVENAIKHGVLQSDLPDRKGVIRSDEKEDCWEVSVTDNGPGIGSKAAPSGESTHIGLENVRERLLYISRGTLEVKSRPDEGTCVIIRIPKK